MLKEKIAGISTVLFNEDHVLRFMVVIKNESSYILKGSLELKALDYTPRYGDSEITLKEEPIQIEPNRVADILLEVPRSDVEEKVHCKEIPYIIELHPDVSSMILTRKSYQNPRLASMFYSKKPRSKLEEERKLLLREERRRYIRETMPGR